MKKFFVIQVSTATVSDLWYIGGIVEVLTAETADQAKLFCSGAETRRKIAVLKSKHPEMEFGIRTVERPQYMMRSSDFSAFVIQDNGEYAQRLNIKGREFGQSTEYAVLKRYEFIPAEESDQPYYARKFEQYYDWMKWASRPDGHGGRKGGTLEEFLERYPEKRIDSLLERAVSAKRPTDAIYFGELNTRCIAAYTRLAMNYNIEEGTVRDIFCAGAEWAINNVKSK